MVHYFSSIKALFFACLFLVVVSSPLYAQQESLQDAETHEIIRLLTDKLVEVYPFPELSSKYKAALLQNETNGNYKGLSEDSLAKRLTSDLRQVHKDVHLRVMQNEAMYRRLTEPRNREEAQDPELPRMLKQNYGFKKVEVDGETSTAYVDVPGPFWGNQEAFEMAAASMNMTAYSRYVILDIRHNPGGTGHMGRFLASYFYRAGEEKFYLNGFYKDRKMDEQEWTYSYVPGRRNPDAKVYILVGPGTGSASEGFAYAMQRLHRATLVGDTTAGAGIAGTFVPLKNNLVAFVPFKMVTAPNADEGWEGTGVIPDINTGERDPLEVTRELIKKDIESQARDKRPAEGVNPK